MKLRHLLFLCIIIVIAASWLYKTSTSKDNSFNSFKNKTERSLSKSAETKLGKKAASARAFVLQKGYNDKTAFFIDMSLASGQPRFFIYDLSKDSLVSSGLVAHGNCFQDWLEGRRYSNVVGSGCTSLGKYKIGIHYMGKFGYSYKLHGLDSSNNNAFERTVVLHSHSCIPGGETPDEICQSNGCPTVAPDFLEQLKKIINNSKKPVLLWIYE